MKPSGRQPGALTNPSIYWLMGIAVACLLVVLGLKLFFDNLQEELREKSANERARLFVGEEIVRGIHGIEKDIYRMAATTSPAGLARVHLSIDEQLDKLHHDLKVLETGGTVRRRALLNLEGHDEMQLEVSYRPDTASQRYVMELIEIAPLLEQVQTKPHLLQDMLEQRQACLDRDDRNCLIRVLPDIAIFLKQIPPYFERLDENANRLFFDSSERLRELEQQLQVQHDRLKKSEMGLISLVMVLAGLTGMLFLRRLNQANRQLEVTLDEMRDAKEVAERASRAKSEFVSRMSHELRTPLNAIIGFAELLEAEPLLPSQKNYVNLINSSGRHLTELINAVLDHAKIEAGGLTLEKIPFDFPAAVAAVESIVREKATAKGLTFIASIDPNLPSHVVGDPTRLRQVLINLLVNAIKFTEQGSVELRIAAYEDRIVFSVRDTGIGMDEAALARLFKPFSQADDSVTRRYGGTGLGLLISKELIEAMGGAIEVESAPEVGSVFWFWLPLRAATASGAITQPALSRPLDVGKLVEGRVLLVDDNRVNQQLAGAMLGRLGLAYEVADNGAEALRRLASADFSLVLMDMEMPEMDGLTATRAYRAREAAEGKAHLPIIAMTANALQEDRERCFAAGMDGYVAKPISLVALQQEIARVCGDSTPAEPVGASPALPPAQWAIFDRVRAIDMMGDEALFEELAGMFIADAPGYLYEIDAALAAADGPRLARNAHTLKGLFATFVAPEGEATARQLELNAQSGALADCDALAGRVRQQAEALSAALAKK